MTENKPMFFFGSSDMDSPITSIRQRLHALQKCNSRVQNCLKRVLAAFASNQPQNTREWNKLEAQKTENRCCSKTAAGNSLQFEMLPSSALSKGAKFSLVIESNQSKFRLLSAQILCAAVQSIQNSSSSSCRSLS